MTYKEAISEIEKIVAELENDKLDVDNLSASVKRVAELIKFCKETLYNTNADIEETLKSFENQ